MEEENDHLKKCMRKAEMEWEDIARSSKEECRSQEHRMDEELIERLKGENDEETLENLLYRTRDETLEAQKEMLLKRRRSRIFQLLVAKRRKSTPPTHPPHTHTHTRANRHRGRFSSDAPWSNPDTTCFTYYYLLHTKPSV